MNATCYFLSVVVALSIPVTTQAAASLSALLVDLELDSDTASLNAARQLSEKRSLPMDAVGPVLKFTKRMAARTVPQRQSQIDGPVKNVPFLGDETNLVKVQASPQSYLNKQVIVCGAISVGSSFYGGYRDAEATHYSLHLAPVTKNGMPADGESCTIYANRKIAQLLVKEIANVQEDNSSRLLIRVHAALVAAREGHLEEDWNEFELIEWQFVTKDQKDWTPGVVSTAFIVRKLVSRLPSSASPAIAEFLLKEKEGFGGAVHGMLLEHLLSQSDTARMAAARKIKQLSTEIVDAQDRAWADALIAKLGRHQVRRQHE